VHEHVGTVFTADEAKPLGIVEPFHGSFQFHFTFLRSAGHPKLRKWAPFLNCV
jgi:hypothetical protein